VVCDGVFSAAFADKSVSHELLADGHKYKYTIDIGSAAGRQDRSVFPDHSVHRDAIEQKTFCGFRLRLRGQT